jgi:hypothetical protein
MDLWPDLQNIFSSAAQSYAADSPNSFPTYLHDWLPLLQANIAELEGLEGRTPANMEAARLKMIEGGQQIVSDINSGVDVASDDAQEWIYQSGLFAQRLPATLGSAMLSNANQAATLPGDSLTAPLQHMASDAATAAANAARSALAGMPWPWIGLGVAAVIILPALLAPGRR